MAQRFTKREQNLINNNFNSSSVSRIVLKLIRIIITATVKRLKYLNAIIVITNKRRLVLKKLLWRMRRICLRKWAGKKKKVVKEYRRYMKRKYKNIV